jgi:hypothetical protein
MKKRIFNKAIFLLLAVTMMFMPTTFAGAMEDIELSEFLDECCVTCEGDIALDFELEIIEEEPIIQIMSTCTSHSWGPWSGWKCSGNTHCTIENRSRPCTVSNCSAGQSESRNGCGKSLGPDENVSVCSACNNHPPFAYCPKGCYTRRCNSCGRSYCGH